VVPICITEPPLSHGQNYWTSLKNGKQKGVGMHNQQPSKWHLKWGNILTPSISFRVSKSYIYTS